MSKKTHMGSLIFRARAVFAIAFIVLMVSAAACGSADQASVATDGAPDVTATSPSVKPTAATPAAFTYPVPEGAAYDESIGGLSQIVEWQVTADRDAVLLLFAAGEDATRPGVRARVTDGAVELMIRDALPQPAAAATQDTAGGSLIAGATMVFPPDDALVILELDLASDAGKPAVRLVWGEPNAQGLVALKVVVEE